MKMKKGKCDDPTNGDVARTDETTVSLFHADT